MAKNKKQEVQTEQPVPAVETQMPPNQAQLGVADLQLMSKIIDLASRRGAFQANELTQVGVVYDKLTAFLAQIEENQKAEQAAKEQEDAVLADE